VSAPDPPSPPKPDDHRPLIVDDLGNRLEQFRLLYDDDAASDQILNELGGQGRVEREMVRDLAAPRPLALPERFFEAHALAMHALEVLARNGSRAPSQLRAGPLTGAARFVAQRVIQVIVRGHQGQVIDSIRDLYARRLAWVPAGDPSRMAMVRARLDVERAMPAYKKKASSVPTFLAGGAAVSSLTTVFRGAAGNVVGSRAAFVVAGVVTFLLLAASSWVVLHGAAIARRRIRLSMDQPLAALWQTVGWCGRPPRDNARAFAAIAIVVTVLGWLVIPLAAVALFAIF
jgi:hypothetical protein